MIRTTGNDLVIAAALLSILTLGGCSAKSDPNQVVSALATTGDATSVYRQSTMTGGPTAKITEVFFVDADVFDRQLSGQIGQNPSEVRIAVEASPAQIPQRLNTWFTEVVDRGGQVSAMTATNWNRLHSDQTDAVQTRGFFLALLPFAFQYVQDRLKQEATYGPSKNYDVVLVTSDDRSRIQNIVFKHKQAAP